MNTGGGIIFSICSFLHSLRQQRFLVSQIRTIYPIQQSVDGKSLSINGFRLPNSDFTGCDEEQIATALGYVSHILYLAAKYLEVSKQAEEKAERRDGKFFFIGSTSLSYDTNVFAVYDIG